MSATTPDGKTVVALLDTGINPSHRAFDRDQVVAWWDFTKDEPKAGQMWDASKPPYDDHGHGTATASMVAARQVDPTQSPSLAPGTKLAIAKVATASGGVGGDIGAAVRWTVTAGADVINISIGSIVPLPGAPTFSDPYAAIAEARSAGVLVVVANGNGVGNTGATPGDGASSTYSSSRHVLAVGAAGAAGLHNSYQPEVAADNSVTVPVHDKPDGVRNTSGTSFSSPFVAGFAARLVTETCAAGLPLSAARLETLVKYSAEDTVMPPPNEGYGVITADRLPAALDHARRGTLPDRPAQDDSGDYVENVAGAERDLNDGKVPGSAPDSPAPRRCGPTAPAVPSMPVQPPQPPLAPASPVTAPAAAPSPAAAATPAPRPDLGLRGARVTVRRGVAHATFTLSAPARVTLVVTRRGQTVVRRTVSAPAAKTTVRLGRVKRGAHELRLTARGAGGATARLVRRFLT